MRRRGSQSSAEESVDPQDKHSADGNEAVRNEGTSIISRDTAVEAAHNPAPISSKRSMNAVVFEGSRVYPSRKLAVTLLAPWHLSVNAGVYVMCVFLLSVTNPYCLHP